MEHLFIEPQITEIGSHVIQTGSHRPPRTALLNVDSRFCDSLATGTNTISTYSVSLPERLNAVKSITCVGAELTNTIYNFSSQLDNITFYLSTDNETFTTCEITAGIYTSESDLATAVSSAAADVLDMSSVTISTSAVGTKYQITIDNTSGAEPIYLYFQNPAAESPEDKYHIRHHLGWNLGFRRAKYTIPSGESLTAESFIDITGPKYLFVLLEDYTNSTNGAPIISQYGTSLAQKNIIGKIPLLMTSFGTSRQFAIQTGTMFSGTVNYNNQYANIQKFKIQLTDEFGRAIDMNQTDFSLTLRIEFQ